MPAAPPARERAIEAFADALHDLLQARALSIGAIDVAVECNDGHVDGEVLFGEGPDIGFTLDAAAGTCAYCELVPPDSERWLDGAPHDGFAIAELAPGPTGDEARAAAALELLRGLLDARRPLLRS